MTTMTDEFAVDPDAPDPTPEQPKAAERSTPVAEVVERSDVPAVRLRDERDSAVAAAADAALAMPGVAGRDEFLMLAAQARLLSMSGAAPKAVRDNPYVAFHVAMIGRDLGISPSASMELIDVIETGGQVRISLSPQLLNGQVRRLGLGSIVPALRTDTECVALALGPGGLDPRCARVLPDHADDCRCHVLGTSTFTWADAQMAGLVAPGCASPTEHTDNCKQNKRDTRKCNQGYRAYPKRMLWWRASGFAADDYFPEAGLGLYTAEELGAVVDAEGRAIDPTTAELPDGYEPRETPTQRAQREAGQPIDGAERNELTLRIRSLPDQHRADYAAKWKAHERLKQHRVETLPVKLAATARSMLASCEATARREGWDEEEAHALTLAAIVGGLVSAAMGHGTPAQAAQEPQDGPEPAAAAQAAPEPAEPPAAPRAPDPVEEQEEPVVTLQRNLEESLEQARLAQQQHVAERAAAEDGDVAALPPRGAERPEVARRMHDLIGDADAARIDDAAAEVKAMHHANVDRALKDLGGFEEGWHIDSRRMLLTAAIVNHRLHPDVCKRLDCQRGLEVAELEGGLCGDHKPF